MTAKVGFNSFFIGFSSTTKFHGVILLRLRDVAIFHLLFSTLRRVQLYCTGGGRVDGNMACCCASDSGS